MGPEEDLNAATESAVPTSILVFHSNYGSILLCFRNMTTGRKTDGRRTDGGKHRISGRQGGPAIKHRTANYADHGDAN